VATEKCELHNAAAVLQSNNFTEGGDIKQVVAAVATLCEPLLRV
jgi:hypothetical protein